MMSLTKTSVVLFSLFFISCSSVDRADAPWHIHRTDNSDWSVAVKCVNTTDGEILVDRDLIIIGFSIIDEKGESVPTEYLSLNLGDPENAIRLMPSETYEYELDISRIYSDDVIQAVDPQESSIRFQYGSLGILDKMKYNLTEDELLIMPGEIKGQKIEGVGAKISSDKD